MRYYVAPNGRGISTNHWNTPGVVHGDLVATVNWIIANPSRGGDEIWAAGDNNVLGAAYQGQYNLAGNPLVINNNTEPLSIYGGFRGTENTLCDRNANIHSIPSAAVPNFFQNPSILDGGNANRVMDIHAANVCLMDGFIIQNGNIATAPGVWSAGGGVYMSVSNNIRFENMVFMNNAARDSGGGMYMDNTRNVMVKNTIFFDNSVTGSGNGGGGFCVMTSHKIKLVNVLFNANMGNYAAACIFDSYDVQIINNTIAYNNPILPNAPSVYCTNTVASNVDIYNSIIFPDTIDIGTFVLVTIDYCLLAAMPTAVPPANVQVSNIILPIGTPPNFVNSAMRDFHLSTVPATAQSRCIDNGNTDFIFPYSATDLEGKPRFIDKGVNPLPSPPSTVKVVDMGAFEVQ